MPVVSPALKKLRGILNGDLPMRRDQPDRKSYREG